MGEKYSCDIIGDLLPGYIDGVLSDTGTGLVKAHLKECEECRRIYEDMTAELKSGADPAEGLALDCFKKIRKRTKYLKIAVGAVSALLAVLLTALLLRVYVVGAPLPTSQITISEIIYKEETEELSIKGTIDHPSERVSRILWEQSEEDANAVNVLVYSAEALPFYGGSREFSITIPNMKGRKAYLACPEYDQLDLYNWKWDHYEEMDRMMEEIYRTIPELNEEKDILNFIGGTETVDGMEGICFMIEYVIGEDAKSWMLNDQIIVQGGDLKSSDFEVWVSFEKPYRILIHDLRTGEYTEDFSIAADRRP